MSLIWKKTKPTGPGLEVADVQSGMLIRDGHNPTQVLYCDLEDWIAFLGSVKDGEFDQE